MAALSLLGPFLLAEPALVTSLQEKGCSLTLQGPPVLLLALAYSFAAQYGESKPVTVLWHWD